MRITNLTPFGIKIEEPDFRNLALFQEWIKVNPLLVVKNARFSHESEFADWCEQFGLLRKQFDYNQDSRVQLISNHAEGNKIEQYAHYHLDWHQDATYPRVQPKRYIRTLVLYCLNPSQEGGNTSFYNHTLAFHDLDPDLQEQAKKLVVRESLSSFYKRNETFYNNAAQKDGFEEKRAQLAETATRRKPLVRLDHCGTPFFDISHADFECFDGFSEVESLDLLKKIYPLKQKHIYTHRWEKYDMVISCNVRLSHARSKSSQTEDRRMLRAQILEGTV